MANKVLYDIDTGDTFKEAFAGARKEGKKVFEWNGKKYNTKLKGEDGPKQGKVKEDPTIEAGKRQKSVSKEDKKEDKDSRGAGAAAAAAGTALGATALLSGMRKSERDRKEVSLEKAAKEREGKAKSGTSLRMPGASMSMNDPHSMSLGSDLDPKRMVREGGRGDMGRGASSLLREMNPQKLMKKGGKVKKYAGGGTTPPPAPKPAPKRTGPPIPEWLQNERKNQEQDRLNRKEREEYDKGEKTRLRDQGGFKKGGVTRGDGCAMRGKTKGRMV